MKPERKKSSTDVTSRRVGRPDSPINTASWLARTANSQATRHALESRVLDRADLERLWALVNVEIWHRIFIDGEAPEDIEDNQPALYAAR